MLHDWGVIAAAFGYIGFLFLVASYGDRLSPTQRGRASALIYPLSLAIYCTSWTFFGSVGFASRTSVDFLAIYVGPILMIALCTPLLRRVIQLAKSQNITSIAVRQEPGGCRDRRGDRDHRIGSLHRAPAQGRGVVARNHPQRRPGLLIYSDRRGYRADRDAGDGGLRGAVRNPPDRRDGTSAWLDAGGRHRIHRETGSLYRGRRIRHVLDVHTRRADRARDEDPGSGARHQLHAIDRQFPDHDAVVVLRDHAAAAPVSRQRGREFQRCRGGPGALAVSAVSGRHQPVRDSDRNRRPRDLSVRRGRQTATCMCWRCQSRGMPRCSASASSSAAFRRQPPW